MEKALKMQTLGKNKHSGKFIAQNDFTVKFKENVNDRNVTHNTEIVIEFRVHQIDFISANASLPYRI